MEFMEILVLLLVILPVAGSLFTFAAPENQERFLAGMLKKLVAAEFLFSLVFLGFWLFYGAPEIRMNGISVFEIGNVDVNWKLIADKVSVVMILTGLLITLVVAKNSRSFLHREHHFKKFAIGVQLFVTGYSTMVMAGNLVTFLIGSLVLSGSLFFFASFFNSIKIAWKTWVLYALSDGLLAVSIFINNSGTTGLIVFSSVLIFCSAWIKMAMLPFEPWLKNVLNSPLEAGGVFFGALGIHLGILLLIRTENLWAPISWFRELLFIFGLLFFLLTVYLAGIQTTTKQKITFFSLAQLTLMLIEIALGWTNAVLVHMALTMLYSTYRYVTIPAEIAKNKSGFGRSSKSLNRLNTTIYTLYFRGWNPVKWFQFKKVKASVRKKQKAFKIV